jgi:hypothetical protein
LELERLGKKILKKEKKQKKTFFVHCLQNNVQKRGNGTVQSTNGVQFLIGWCDFPLDKDDTWEPITNLPGSEHMITEFQKH